jgi:hypothetical protein
MAWGEANRVDDLFGWARNERLTAEITADLAQAAAESRQTGKPARRCRDLMWTTVDSGSWRRRVGAEAASTRGEAILSSSCPR